MFHWPLFCLLAAFHLAVLPLLLTERDDVRVSVTAGVVYILLALADIVDRRSALSR